MKVAIATGLMLLGLTTTAGAHHSPAGYARDTVLMLQGRVAEYEWSYPHVYIHVDVPSSDGTQRWHVEANPPTILRRRGWTEESLEVGEAISVNVTPSVDRSRHLGFAHTVTKSDGTRLINFQLSPQPQAETPSEPTARTNSLTGTWLTEPGPLLGAVFGVLGQPQAELTAAGTAALDEFDEETMHPGIDCIPFPPPVYMVIPNVMTIGVGTETTTIRADLEGVERIVHMTVGTHDGAPEAPHGHSIGHWEDDVLVVDTASFSPHRIGTVFRVPSGPDKRLVERFELDPDGTSLSYSFDLTDPDYLAEPITDRMQWRFRPDLEYSPVECDPANARRFTGRD